MLTGVLTFLSIIYSSFLLELQQSVSTNVSHLSISEMSWASQQPSLDQLS